MGQRLVVTIKDGERKLAAVYYHWSAYTYNALLETRDIINCIYNGDDETEAEMLLRLIRFLEDNGGGISCTETYDEHQYIQSLYPNETFKRDNYSRNNGLIALSEQGIAVLQYWSEGDVDIDISQDAVDFTVYRGYSNLAEYIEEQKYMGKDFDPPKADDIAVLDFNLGYFDVQDIDHIISKIDNLGNVHLVNCGGEICEFIE